VAHAHSLAGRKVADAEDERFEPWRAGGDLVDAATVRIFQAVLDRGKLTKAT
jgi:hypothetical protein